MEEVPGRRRSAVGRAAGDMQAAPARYVSVSELYSTDEVELLLDEIRELEPTSCRGEDVQDFEIAGSGCGAGGGGGRSPAGTELSWDSHAQYRVEAPPAGLPLAPLYCHWRALLSLGGATRIVLVGSAIATISVLWARWGVRLPSTVRPLALAALSSVLLHSVLLSLRVTRLHRLMPLDWLGVGVCACVWACVSLTVAASMLLYDTLQEYPHDTMHLAAVGLSYVGACAGGAAGAAAARRRWQRAPAAPRDHYRAVPTHPPL